jgi:hydrogenase-4 component F
VGYILAIQLIWTAILKFLPLRFIYIAQVFISGILFVGTFSYIPKVIQQKIIFEVKDYLFLDSLNVLILTSLLFLVFCIAIYSIGYMKKEQEHGLSAHKVKSFYMWKNLFVFCMSAVLLSNNFGIIWIAIEGTTLSTTFLIGFYNTKEAVKASWHYIIICSFGIALGLFGVVTLYFATYHALGEGMSSLNWVNIIKISHNLDPALLKISFAFFLVGFGTKAGLAPMHSWLPDAHSQAPTPISALMSGVLLSSALYVILRLKAIVDTAGLVHFTSNLLLIVGMISIFVAAIAIIGQKDYKRLLAFSSMEHMGLMAFAFGIGNRLGIFAGLLHLINHVFAKGLMFSSIGSILVNFHTREIAKIKGLYKSMPLTAVFITLGVLGITGIPPFNIFVSEFLILTSALDAHMYWQIVVILIFLVMIFGGFIYLFSSMLMGKSDEKKKEDYKMLIPMLMLLAMMIYLGITMPENMKILLNNAVDILLPKVVS